MTRYNASNGRRLSLKPGAAAVAAALVGGSAPWTVMAQPPNAAERPLEQIIVTAARRETTVQELPFNIAAVGAETLEGQRLADLAEFSRWVPGLTVVEQGARAADLMTVRGLNVRSLNASEFLGNTAGETVATYLGEIPLYVDYRMKDLERVEVLLGPQGTLYGAGTLAGALRYIPAAPDTQQFSFEVHGDAYSLTHGGTGYDADLAVNVPIVEGSLAFRGAFAYLDDSGFIDYPFVVREPGVSDPQPDFSDPAEVAANLRRVEDADTEETLSGRLALLWDITANVQATFNYYFQDQDVGARTINHRHAFDTGRYESGHRFLEPNDRENSLFSVEVVADLGFAELTSATGIAQYDEIGQRDQTDLLLDFEYGYEDFPSFAAFTREIADEETLSQELRLVSTGSGPLSWIVGLFYNEFELDATSEEFTPGIPEFFGLDLPTGDLEFLQVTRQTLTEEALFGEVTFDVTDRLGVTVGGRWFRFEDDAFTNFDLPLIGFFGEGRGNVADDDGVLGKLNFSYAFNENVSGYATLSEGYRIGGVNPIAECIIPLPPGQNVCALPREVLFEPDTTVNLELGVHSSLGNGRLSLDASVFEIDWEDIQTQTTTENGAIPITTNGSEARSRGAEVAFQWRPTDRWTLFGSYAYTDAELTSDAPELVDGFDAFAGDRLSGTPKHQGSIGIDYFQTLENGWALEAAYGLTSTSDVLTKVGMRADGEELSGYTLHNLSVGMSRERWSATLYADNLTDEFAETGVRLDPSFIRNVDDWRLRRYFRNVLRPRTVGIEFRYRFSE